MNAALDEATQLFKAGNRDRTSFQLLIESGRARNETIEPGWVTNTEAPLMVEKLYATALAILYPIAT